MTPIMAASAARPALRVRCSDLWPKPQGGCIKSGARPPCHGGPVPSGARPPPAGRSPVVPGFGPLGLVVVVPCCLACRPCWWWSVVSAGLGGCAAGALRPFGASPPCSWRLWPPCRPWSVVSASVVVGDAPTPVVSGRVARPPGRSATPPRLCPVGRFAVAPARPCGRASARLLFYRTYVLFGVEKPVECVYNQNKCRGKGVKAYGTAGSAPL